jgi:hypothetical protein
LQIAKASPQISGIALTGSAFHDGNKVRHPARAGCSNNELDFWRRAVAVVQHIKRFQTPALERS